MRGKLADSEKDTKAFEGNSIRYQSIFGERVGENWISNISRMCVRDSVATFKRWVGITITITIIIY